MSRDIEPAKVSEGGAFIAVVGASGVGKDSILDGARLRLGDRAGYHFPRRFITRAPTAGGEPHISVSKVEFEGMRGDGAFYLHWAAHGLLYGISNSIEDQLAAGKTIICNVSRTVLGQLSAKPYRCAAVQITAEPSIIRQRLIARGRETLVELERRQARSPKNDWVSDVPLFEITNDATLQSAVDAFVDRVRHIGENLNVIER